jgi:DNA-binding beta-propeller fold protein YncE
MKVRSLRRPLNASATRTFFRQVRKGGRGLAWLVLVTSCVLFLWACRRRTYTPQPYVAFVANNQSHTLAAVDLANFRMLASIPVAPHPERVLVRPGSLELYAVSASGTLSVISIPERRVTATLHVGRTARDLVFSADGRRGFVLEPAQGQIVFLDTAPLKEQGRLRLAAELSSLALSPDQQTLVAASAKQNRLFVIGVEKRQVLGSIEVGKSPGPLTILPYGHKVFVADTGEQKITAADFKSRQVLSHLEIGSEPSALILKPDGGEIFVLSREAAKLIIVDAFHDNVEQILSTGRGPAAGLLNREASVLYLATAEDGTVTTFDLANRMVRAATQTGVAPCALALTPDQRFLVVADSATSSLAVLRTDRSALVTTIPVGSQPIDVVVPDWLAR